MSPAQTDPSPPGADAVRFTALWEAYAGRVLAYALRHTDHHLAQEVVSETFLVAWRRLADVPGDPLPWLLVVARNTVRNQHRSGYRRGVLEHEISRLHELAVPAPGVDEVVAERADVLAALAALTGKEREALLLVAWDGLAPADAARVAGCSVPTFHVRLHRARRRLRGHQSATDAHDPLPVLSPRSAP
ncbi:RNA polymerase sigma factor [Pseudokineococcus marinus]|uniref:RNA polymerase sigma factor n=1 Tax=Pseudokineococcus marinus TaxID=351215 RepID=A0A849BMU0_9ACTN|nr:RNA polymerase sigma factor [Pseudokineococcus marinus]NNH22102.1 RNA polymerase sigma factor [Pseudokineococcus marinus]